MYKVFVFTKARGSFWAVVEHQTVELLALLDNFSVYIGKVVQEASRKTTPTIFFFLAKI